MTPALTYAGAGCASPRPAPPRTLEFLVPNAVAFLALYMVVPVAIVLYVKLSAERATLVLLLWCLLFLPEGTTFDLPGIPKLTKQSLPVLCATIGVLLKAWGKVRAARWGRGVDVFAWISIIAVFGAILTNDESLSYGPLFIPGVTLYDGVSWALAMLLNSLLPFLLARALFRSEQDAVDLLRLLVLFAVLYVPFILFELRMAPVLHYKVYGFNQHSFVQSVRAGGYRPMVFMPHGLALALFLFCASLAAWTLVRARRRLFWFSAKPFAYALVGLVALVHSLGALVYTLVATVLFRFWPLRRQWLFKLALIIIVVSFPYARTTQLFPTHDLVALAADISTDRAQSLQYRFDMEDILVQRANEKPVFGWGPWGRNQVYNERGESVSVSDGAWVIALGSSGSVGFIGSFGLILAPLFMARRAVKRLRRRDRRALLVGLSWIVVLCAVDLLPNGTFNCLGTFLAGALAGLSQGLPKQERDEALGAAV